MALYKNELSNISYTNKDFSTIYPELLDLAKKISYKWDPSMSDESDPGVVLLKLAALMADKCNYNIDKNVLELFPASVTQLSNARQLFDQCGYTMRHYTSATTEIDLRLITEPSISESDIQELSLGVLPSDSITFDDVKSSKVEYVRHYIIPKFTMFSDAENSIVYTMIEDADLKSDGSVTTVSAVEGTFAELSVNGLTILTADMLDHNNRLYFTGTNVAENGIFISNIDDDNYWEAKDNLLVHPLGSKIFKFGVTLDGSRCYVEFPSDIESLIAGGLNVRYVMTSGYNGNIGKKFLKQFFNETKCSRRLASFPSKQSDVAITNENVYIVNNNASENGRDPETIEQAYRNYQKVKTTFNTLVSTTDYSNYLRTNKALSNCIVCDRSDDIQSSYKVLNTIDNVHQLIPFVRKSTKSVSANYEGNPVTVDIDTDEMTAFDLRVYGLRYVDNVDTYTNFTRSFDLNLSHKFEKTEDIKCLAHNYLEFEPRRIILLKNKYPIIAKLVSGYKLTISQQEEIVSNVKLALFHLLNSQKLEFGEEVDYNLVYDTILKADNRINAVALYDIEYETYAFYLDSDKVLKNMRIDSKSEPPKDDAGNYVDKDLWNEFRAQIYSKSILEGKTPLFIPDSTFIYSLAHENLHNQQIHAVDYISSSVNIPLTKLDDGKTLESRILKPNDVITLTSPNLITDQPYSSYVQYITNIGVSDSNPRPTYNTTYGESVISADDDYVLKEDEYIVFFWRDEGENSPYNYVKYTGNDKDTPIIISPSFDMYIQCEVDARQYDETAQFTINDDFFLNKLGNTTGDENRSIVEGMIYPSQVVYTTYKNGENTINVDLLDFLAKCVTSKHFNVKTNTIETKKINRIHLNNTIDGTDNFYWILNNIVKVDNKEVYRLFSKDQTEYTLQEGEQLIYSNPRLTQFYILGAGTKIERSSISNGELNNWDCPALKDKIEFLEEGPKYFNNIDHPWFTINSAKYKMYATEMLYEKISADTKLKIIFPSSSDDVPDELYVTSSGIRSKGNNEEITTVDCSFIVVNDEGTERQLPNRNHTLIAWKLYSSCNINMSKESPQRVYSEQSLEFYDSDSNDPIISIEGSDTESIYIQSDVPTTRNGGSKIDVRVYDILSEKYDSLQVYIYRLKDADKSSDYDANTSSWKFTDDGIDVSGVDVRLSNIRLTSGKYLLPLSVKKLESTNFVTLSWIPLRTLEAGSLSEAEIVYLEELKYENWREGNSPVTFDDFAQWVYGYVGIDVSDCLQKLTHKEYDPKSPNPPNLQVGDIIYTRRNDISEELLDLVDTDDSYLLTDDSEQLVVSNSKVLSVALYRGEDKDLLCVYSDGECSMISLEVLNSLDVEKYLFHPVISTEVYDGCRVDDVNSSYKKETVTDIDVNRNQTYYFIVDVESTAPSYMLRLKTNIKEGTQNVSPQFQIPSLMKFDYPKLNKDDDQDISADKDLYAAILNQIKHDDITSKFDFMYSVPDSDIVEYPLESKSFLNPDHPMNKFTICQYVLSDNKLENHIQVVGRSR